MCSCGAFVKFAKVIYFHHHGLRRHLFPSVPLVLGSKEVAVGMWGPNEEVPLETHLVGVQWGTSMWFGHFQIDVSDCWPSQHGSSSRDSDCPLHRRCRAGHGGRRFPQSLAAEAQGEGKAGFARTEPQGGLCKVLVIL